MKVIKSLENSGTAWKITSSEGGFFNFLKPLMTTGLPLIKSVITSLTSQQQMQLFKKKLMDQE